MKKKFFSVKFFSASWYALMWQRDAVSEFSQVLTNTWLCSRAMRFQSRPTNWPSLTIESPVAQWLEHPTRSRRVVGSSPIWGSDFSIKKKSQYRMRNFHGFHLVQYVALAWVMLSRIQYWMCAEPTVRKCFSPGRLSYWYEPSDLVYTPVIMFYVDFIMFWYFIKHPLL